MNFKHTFFTIFFVFKFIFLAQSQISGFVLTEENTPVNKVQIYNSTGGILAETNPKGYFQFSINVEKMKVLFYSENFKLKELVVFKNKSSNLSIILNAFTEELSEIQIKSRKNKIFELKRLKDVVGTSIFAGKKTEVVLVAQSTANLASNNARQIYSQVAGLNIFQNDDAGLQLNIGGRGLDPNRTSNFNTRQNGYDISADVLGYPESYYTPASESLEEIQIVRGAASLQYGTQFGGLVNFITKSPNPNKVLDITTRNTLGSYGLFTNFTSLSGTKNKLSYYSYINYKRGEGFRPNSEFESKNAFLHLGYDLDDKNKFTLELTYLDYLAQQAGGLTDDLFNENPYQSNRKRNWFGLYWFLYNIKFEHTLSDNSNISVNFFGLNAQRNAIGFRSNRVSQIDPYEERDLIKGDFNNFGIEARWLKKYILGNKKAVFLLGGKYYSAKNTSAQGPGSASNEADFSFYNEEYPSYSKQSNYTYPNENMSIFSENIFYINKRMSVTPGLRYENILTATEGNYQRINSDAAGNVILNETLNSIESRRRSFVLLGLGLSYKASQPLEYYSNISQNYRSVTFADISIINPAFSINPNITDEKGYTIDLGIRGKIKKMMSFDLNFFYLSYQNRIGFIQKAFKDGSVKSERGNVGDANLSGLESLIDLNIGELFKMNLKKYSLNSFINYSFIETKYSNSDIQGIKDKKVEFVPKDNLKFGLRYGYKNLTLNIQFSYVSEQFTDSSNAFEGNLSGVIGVIPAYELVDLSGAFKLNKFKLEFGVNNTLNEAYFTRRATGYPGPGIIPSPGRNFYLSTQYKF